MNENTSRNLTYSFNAVRLEERWVKNGHKSGILWFTGLSGSGKTTLATLLEQRLFERGFQVCILDGDNVRHGLSSDLGFSPEDRCENIRRIGEAAKLMALSGQVVITAFISPYRADRRQVRRIAGDLFSEIFIDASLETCESRDPKGLYKKARLGEIPDFTGISAPYEAPENPDLRLMTSSEKVEESLVHLERFALNRFVLA